MRYLILFMLIATNAFSLTVTDLEYDNLGVVDTELRKTYPQFGGFNGSKADMKVYGITDQEARTEINKMNIEQLIEDEKITKEKKSVENKLKVLGLTNEEIKLLVK